ncbi:3'(2'),5'-bisphosphate nucleotidase CysQ family protein [Coraliomargarita sinensis]|nr:inositol monophosphatase family protein [Coraliomargarita sinensis]
MRLNEEQLLDLSGYAASAARKAGALISDYAKREVEVMHKSGGDSLASQVVTEVDELAQSIILEELRSSVQDYDLALLTEELQDDGSRLKKDYFWCIDPMDGTLPFTRGTPGYSVAIALVARDGCPMIGVVYDPVEKRLYQAVHGQSVLIDGEVWQLTSPQPRSGAVLRFYCDCTFEENPERESLSRQMRDFAKAEGYAAGEVIIGGGAVLNACHVLLHRPAVYFKRPKAKTGGGSFWDFAATACLFNEAGAQVSDFSGRTLELNDPKRSFFNHCGVCFTTESGLTAKLGAFFS